MSESVNHNHHSVIQELQQFQQKNGSSELETRVADTVNLSTIGKTEPSESPSLVERTSTSKPKGSESLTTKIINFIKNLFSKPHKSEIDPRQSVQSELRAHFVNMDQTKASKGSNKPVSLPEETKTDQDVAKFVKDLQKQVKNKKLTKEGYIESIKLLNDNTIIDSNTVKTILYTSPTSKEVKLRPEAFEITKALLSDQVGKASDYSSLIRGNSLSSKSLTEYLKHTGKEVNSKIITKLKELENPEDLQYTDLVLSTFGQLISENALPEEFLDGLKLISELPTQFSSTVKDSATQDGVNLTEKFAGFEATSYFLRSLNPSIINTFANSDTIKYAVQETKSLQTIANLEVSLDKQSKDLSEEKLKQFKPRRELLQETLNTLSTQFSKRPKVF